MYSVTETGENCCLCNTGIEAQDIPTAPEIGASGLAHVECFEDFAM